MSNKKPRIAPGLPTHGLNMPRPTLSMDLCGLVMSYLNTPELFHMAFSCKGMMKKVTMQMVVSSGSNHDQHLRTLFAIHNLMSRMCIHPLSPLRLLRLLNARRCENCNRVPTRNIHPTYGVVLCRFCRSPYVWHGFCHRYEELPYEREIDWHVRLARVPRRHCVIVWARRLVHGDEVCGPLATVQELMELSRTRNPLEAFNQSIPPVHLYRDFLEAFEQLGLKEAKRLDLRDERKEECHDNAVATMMYWIKRRLDSRYSGIALQTIPDGFRFRCPAVDEILRDRIVGIPSYGIAIDHIATTIRLYFTELVNFCNLSFLDEKEHLFDRHIKRYYKSVIMPDIPSIVFRSVATKKFFESLQAGNHMRTLAELVKNQNDHFRRGRIYKWLHMLGAAHYSYFNAPPNGDPIPDEAALCNSLCQGIDCFSGYPKIESKLKDIDAFLMRDKESSRPRMCKDKAILVRLRRIFADFCSNSLDGSPIGPLRPTKETPAQYQVEAVPTLWCSDCSSPREVKEFPRGGDRCRTCMMQTIQTILYVPKCCALAHDQLIWRHSFD